MCVCVLFSFLFLCLCFLGGRHHGYPIIELHVVKSGVVLMGVGMGDTEKNLPASVEQTGSS